MSALSEQWRIEHAGASGTRVSAQLRDAPGDPQRGAPTAAHELHVMPEPRAGTWRVYAADATAHLSEHTTTTAAEAAAHVLAQASGCSRVVIHDRYHRTYLSPAPKRSTV